MVGGVIWLLMFVDNERTEFFDSNNATRIDTQSISLVTTPASMSSEAQLHIKSSKQKDDSDGSYFCCDRVVVRMGSDVVFNYSIAIAGDVKTQGVITKYVHFNYIPSHCYPRGKRMLLKVKTSEPGTVNVQENHYCIESPSYSFYNFIAALLFILGVSIFVMTAHTGVRIACDTCDTHKRRERERARPPLLV